MDRFWEIEVLIFFYIVIKNSDVIFSKTVHIPIFFISSNKSRGILGASEKNWKKSLRAI